MRPLFLGLALFVIGMLSWASIRLGFFKEVVLTEQDQPEMHLVYIEHIGPYHKILASLEKVEEWAKKNKIDCSKSFGHYLDDPDVVEHERLRSHVGCITDDTKTELPPDFKTKNLPAGKYLVAEFSGSPAIGPMKVYKKAQAKFAEKGLTAPEDIIEIYHRIDEKSMKTIYLFKM